MFSGKSSNLLARVRREKIAGKNVLLVRHRADTRYASTTSDVVTHDAVRAEALAASTIGEALDAMHSADVVAIDEIQWFEDLHLLEELDPSKACVVAGLLHQYTGAVFPTMFPLLPLLDNIVFFHAVCAVCKSQNASRSHRFAPPSESLVGGSEAYRPLCWQCFKVYAPSLDRSLAPQ